MKRVIYISLVFAGLSAVSCSKQNIQPNAETTQEAPVWRSAGDDTGSTSGTTTTGEGGITDPNNDKDESGRRKN